MSRNRYPSPDTNAIEEKLVSAIALMEMGINGVVNSKNRPEAATELDHIRRAVTATKEARNALKTFRENEKRLRAAVAYWHEKAKEKAVT